MHQLLTIDDLKTLPETEKNRLIELAMKLSNIYFDFIVNDFETFTYETTIFGEETREDGIHASEASGCLKKLVYAIQATERRGHTDDRNMKMRFRIGHAVHGMLQKDWHRIAEKSGGRILFEDEVRIHPSMGGAAEFWDLHSHCDGIITICELVGSVWVPAIRVGMEIKTESGPQYENLKSPREYHEEQVCIYQKALDLPIMWMFYYNKSNSNITTSFPPWFFKFDEVLWEKMEMRFVKAQHRAETNNLPDNEEGMPCSWCPFSWTCKPKILKNKRKRGTLPTLPRGMTPGR